MPGHLTIADLESYTWADIKTCIVTESRKRPIDLVLIDYLALADVSESHNPVAAINEIIKQAKGVCLRHDHGRGVAIVTPIQGNRKGLDAATEAGGMWSADGVHTYSEFEKSVDKLLYVYADDEMRAAGLLRSDRASHAVPATSPPASSTCTVRLDSWPISPCRLAPYPGANWRIGDSKSQFFDFQTHR